MNAKIRSCACTHACTTLTKVHHRTREYVRKHACKLCPREQVAYGTRLGRSTSLLGIKPGSREQPCHWSGRRHWGCLLPCTSWWTYTETSRLYMQNERTTRACTRYLVCCYTLSATFHRKLTKHACEAGVHGLTGEAIPLALISKFTNGSYVSARQPQQLMLICPRQGGLVINASV